jgi:hypothetical protein
LQRAPGDTYVLWSAFPLLSPRRACWVDDYDYTAHRPATRLPDVFYHFLNCYLSVTSIYLGVDAVIQGATDFVQLEPADAVDALITVVQSLQAHNLPAADRVHLTYELSIRCLDETLPDHYVARPEVFVEALQRSLSDARRPQAVPEGAVVH